MRALLHLGLFALAFGTVASADAQGRRRNPAHRQTTVVVDTRPTPVPRHDWRRVSHPRARSSAHLDLQRQRRDHEEIVRISHRWRQASYNRNPHAKRNLHFRANAWIDREVAESRVRPYGSRLAFRLRALQRELNTSHRGYGHRRGAERKARVLDELVALSAVELRRAEIDARRHMRLAFSVR